MDRRSYGFDMTEIRPDFAVPVPTMDPQVRSGPGKTEDRTIRFDPRNVWRVGFVVHRARGSCPAAAIRHRRRRKCHSTVLMAWFASIAMEPAVARLSRHMRRGAATGLVMLAAVVFGILFMLAFGKLFIDQVAQLLEGLPRIADSVVAAINKRADSNYQVEDILTQLNITPSQVAGYAAQVVGRCWDYWIGRRQLLPRCSPSDCSRSTSPDGLIPAVHRHALPEPVPAEQCKCGTSQRRRPADMWLPGSSSRSSTAPQVQSSF
jgi:hypothetical protein